MTAMRQAQTPFRCVGLFGRPQTEGLAAPLRRIITCVRQMGIAVWVEQDTASSAGLKAGEIDGQSGLAELSKIIDLAIILGGDGTLLGVARQLAPTGTALIGVNQGRLGFMTDLDIAQVESELPAVLQGDYVEEERAMLQVSVMRKKSGSSARTAVFDAPALNDAVISRGAISRMVEVEIFVDGHYLQTLRADGLIISTPTGSTAYALSALGSILHPALAGITLVPVAPQALSSRPIVLPESVEVQVVVNDGAGTSLHCDMQSLTSLEDGDKIVVRHGAHKVRLLHPRGYDYFVMLRRKLHWSTNPLFAGRPDPLPPTEPHVST
jgi:NAD+ kinase